MIIPFASADSNMGRGEGVSVMLTWGRGKKKGFFRKNKENKS
jgi:hypothetical protein